LAYFCWLRERVTRFTRGLESKTFSHIFE